MPSADSVPEDTVKLENQSINPRPEPATAPTPGARANAFLALYQKTLSTTLRTISYDNFAACFPTIAENAPENLKGLHKAMIERLEGFAQKDFESLIRERSVIENLNALEELIQDASRRKARAVAGEEPPTPPHLLPPTSVLHAHLAPQLALAQSQLNAKLQTTQSQNATLYQTILGQRAEIEALVEGLERGARDLEAADGRLAEASGGGGLRGLLTDTEVEMGGA